MTVYRVTFTPLEPYFFGNEQGQLSTKKRSTEASVTVNRYYVRSECIPSQSTLFGALRYLLMPVKRTDWQYTAEEARQNAAAVGAASFDPSVPRSFGKLRCLSPMFLYDGATPLVATPFDHIVGNHVYTPFSQYERVTTPQGERWFTREYRAKDGVTHDYMRLSDGVIVPRSELFSRVIRTGVNHSEEERGLFKRELCRLASGYAFGVYLTAENDLIPHDGTVFLGQGKAAFAVRFVPEEDCLAARLAHFLRDDVVYCMGDVFTDASIYAQSLFAVTALRTYRAYAASGERVSKAAVLHRLIAAGSVFIPQDKTAFMQATANEAVSRVGYNILVDNGGKLL